MQQINLLLDQEEIKKWISWDPDGVRELMSECSILIENLAVKYKYLHNHLILYSWLNNFRFHHYSNILNMVLTVRKKY